MPREFVFASERAIDLGDELLGATEDDPDWGIRAVWNGGAVQFFGPDGVAVLTVLRSIVVEARSSADRLLPAGFGEHGFWTEAYAPEGEGAGERIARNIAASAGAQLYVDGVIV